MGKEKEIWKKRPGARERGKWGTVRSKRKTTRMKTKVRDSFTSEEKRSAEKGIRSHC